MKEDLNDNSQVTSVLLSEYERLCADIRSIESSNEKVVGLGIILMSIGFIIGIVQDIHAVFFVVPVGILSMVFYSLMTYTNIFSMAGYKRHLEDQLNNKLGKKVIIWEQLVLEREKGTIARITLLIIFGIVSFCILGISTLHIYDIYGLIAVAGTGLLFILFVGLILLSIRNMSRTTENMYRISKKLSK